MLFAPTPAIQRWRVLKGDSGVLARPIAPGGGLPYEVNTAPPEKWEPVYAKVDGSLPLEEAKAKAAVR